MDWGRSMRIQPHPQTPISELGQRYSGGGDPGVEKIEEDLLLLTSEAEAEGRELREIQ